MTPATPGKREREATSTWEVLEALCGPAARWPFRIRLWQGSTRGPAGAGATVAFNRPGALRRMLLPPSHLAMGEAFLRGDLDVEGDVGTLAEAYPTLAARLWSPGALARLAPLVLALPDGSGESGGAGDGSGGRGAFRPPWRSHTRAHDAAAVRYHYDVGNDFYALWLDRRMVYSCAYFPTGGETLDEAQEAKLDLVCRKLRLRPGERLLDIGCGWGGLIQFAAERYGVDATGITLSPAQASLATARIKAAGLERRCRVVLCDYRDLAPAARFDKVASVAMYEQVGRVNLPLYFRHAFRLTRPGGLFLFHGITRTRQGLPRDRWEALRWAVFREEAFTQRYTFPGGYLATLGEIVSGAEGAGFETRDVESLREHYATTLRHWGWRLEAGREEALRRVGETTYRVWRLYMGASAHEFAAGTQGLVQGLFARQGERGAVSLPPTRADLYCSVPTAPASSPSGA